MNTKERAAFENGIVCAAAWLVSTHGEDTAALEMIDHLVGRDSIKRADEHDREILKPLLSASSDQTDQTEE